MIAAEVVLSFEHVGCRLLQVIHQKPDVIKAMSCVSPNNVVRVFRLPVVKPTAGKLSAEIDLGFHQKFVGFGVGSHPGISFPATSQDKHHRPICTSENTSERFLVGMTRIGALPRVRMDPDAGELIGPKSFFDLILEVVGNRLIIKRYRRKRTRLLYQLNVFNEQRISRANPKRPDFGITKVTQAN